MPHQETRKIIRVGLSSYGIILPRAWLRYFDLTDKNYVTVFSNGNVVIEPKKMTKSKDSTNRDQNGN